ncbi:MAG: hypothetical protein IT368_04790, partial [Candidatus Hydrogenedentes bacterium]|nr:hypothetical protein [Candidatus Hydrogenedentota bacterium]
MNNDLLISPNRRRRRRRLSLALLSVLALLMGGAILLYLIPRTETALPALPPLHLETQFSTSTSASSTAADGSRFAMATIEIHLDGDSPMLVHCAQALRTALEAHPGVTRVQVMNPEDLPSPEEARRTADIQVTLSCTAHAVDGGLFSRNARGTFHAAAGSQRADPAHSVMDEDTPPLVEWDWNADLDYEIRAEGFDPRGSTDTQAAERIAQALYDSLKQQLDGMAQSHALLPPLPDAFYGPYAPPPDLPDLPNLAPRLAGSGYGLLNHNDTLWVLDLPPRDTQFLQQLKQAMAAEGWKEYAVEIGGTPWLRLERNEDMLEAFPWPAPDAQPSDAPESPIPPSQRWCLRYVDQFDSAQREAALESLLAAQADVDTLLIFQNEFKRSTLRQQFLDRLAASELLHPQVLILLAHQDQRNGDLEAALKRFRMAVALAWLGAGQQDYQSGLKQLAHAMGLAEEETTTPRVDSLLQLGLVPVEQLSNPVSVTLRTGMTGGVFHAVGDQVESAAVVRISAENGGLTL